MESSNLFLINSIAGGITPPAFHCHFVAVLFLQMQFFVGYTQTIMLYLKDRKPLIL